MLSTRTTFGDTLFHPATRRLHPFNHTNRSSPHQTRPSTLSAQTETKTTYPTKKWQEIIENIKLKHKQQKQTKRKPITAQFRPKTLPEAKGPPNKLRPQPHHTATSRPLTNLSNSLKTLFVAKTPTTHHNTTNHRS